MRCESTSFGVIKTRLDQPSRISKLVAFRHSDLLSIIRQMRWTRQSILMFKNRVHVVTSYRIQQQRQNNR